MLYRLNCPIRGTIVDESYKRKNFEAFEMWTLQKIVTDITDRKSDK